MTNQLNFGDTYEILEEIGSGGGGTVYRAYHKRLQKEVALKKIHSELKNVNARTETDILKNIKHQYLPQVLDFLETENGIYTVMEFISGKSLKEYLDEKNPVNIRQSVTWFIQLCEALEVLHYQKPSIIHGDIKPANIMITAEGNICLIDFNIASIFEGAKTIVSGYTPGYAAPEQIEFINQKRRQATVQTAARTLLDGEAAAGGRTLLDGEAAAGERTLLDGEAAAGGRTLLDGETAAGERTLLDDGKTAGSDSSWNVEKLRTVIDTRTDIYSLGATIYHLLTGQKPRARQGSGAVVPVQSVNPKISAALAHIVDKCVMTEPVQRYQSVTEIRIALQNLYQSEQRYKKLILKQNLARAAMLAGIAGFAALSLMSYRRINLKKDAAYENFVRLEQQCVESGDAAGMERYYSDAVAIFPEEPEAYQWKAQLLYNGRDYAEAESFLLNVAIPYTAEGTGKANLFLLLANCYMGEEAYRTAQGHLEEALALDVQNAFIYRDYAICLAKNGDVRRAEQNLESAIALGLENDGITYTNGEISYAKGDLEIAKEEFSNCSETTADADMRLRAYLMQIQILKEQEMNIDTCQQRTALAQRALQRAEAYQRLALWEELAQAYMDLGIISGEPQYDAQAREICREMIANGYGTFQTHQNIVILCQKNGAYEEEEAELTEMQKLYGEDYRIYKYLAFLEVAKQEQQNTAERSYEVFAKYYNKTIELYEQGNRNQTDADIERLKQLYEQAVSGGWL